MDPFESVLRDAQTRLSSAQSLLTQYRGEKKASTLADLHLTIQDLSEVIHELSGSIAAVQSNPRQFGLSALEIDQRIEQVGEVNNQVNDIQEALAAIRNESRDQKSTFGNSYGGSRYEDDTAFDGGEVNAEDRQMLFQTTLREQDSILDEVEQTVASLREQANVMSRELDDQADLIDDFENQVDLSNDRLRRGMQRVNYVLRNNRECMSNCCIMLLAIVLIILLVLVIAL